MSETFGEVLNQYKTDCSNLASYISKECTPFNSNKFSDFASELYTALLSFMFAHREKDSNEDEESENTAEGKWEDYKEWFDIEWGRNNVFSTEYIDINDEQAQILSKQYYIPLIKLKTERKTLYVIIRPDIIDDDDKCEKLKDFVQEFNVNGDILEEFKITEEELEKIEDN